MTYLDPGATSPTRGETREQRGPTRNATLVVAFVVLRQVTIKFNCRNTLQLDSFQIILYPQVQEALWPDPGIERLPARTEGPFFYP